VTRYSGCQYINKFTTLDTIANHSFLDARTSKIVNEEWHRQTSEQQPQGKARKQVVVEKVVSRSKPRMEEAFSFLVEAIWQDDHERSRERHYQRERLDDSVQAEARKHVVTIEPVVDGRIQDKARE